MKLLSLEQCLIKKKKKNVSSTLSGYGTELPVLATLLFLSSWVTTGLGFQLISRSAMFDVGKDDYVSSFSINEVLNFSPLVLQVPLRGVEIWLVHHITIICNINKATTYLSVHHMPRTVLNTLHEATYSFFTTV